MRNVSSVSLRRAARPRRLLAVSAAVVLASASLAVAANVVSPNGIQGTGHVSAASAPDGIQGSGHVSTAAAPDGIEGSG
jgi:hypothetical protein